ncbi:MAG: hypothetical protein NTX13_10960 [Acidobacteria bacterium]|nr:hypothetical protein [Acidobacteriota bacterium]
MQLNLIALKPQLERWHRPELLTQNLLTPARQKETTILTMVRRDEKRIAGVRETVASLFGNGQEVTPTGGVRASAANQPILAIDKIRREFRAEADPIISDLHTLAEGAAEIAKRHWDIHSILRRATTGTGSTIGVSDALTRRANYHSILQSAGKSELANWAQMAIDDMDLVLADACVRANDRRERNERAFSSGDFLDTIGENLTEFRLARAILNETILTAERAGIAFAKFENPNGGASIARIIMGLRLMEHADYTVDEQGGILLSPSNANYLRSKAIGTELKTRARTGGNAIERAKAGLAAATAQRAQMTGQREG